MKNIKLRAYTYILKEKAWRVDHAGFSINADGTLNYQFNYLGHHSHTVEFIGGQDRTGKDVYRADILLLGDDDRELIAAVVKHELGYGLMYQRLLNKIYPLNMHELNHATVIGNVYQNPELIKIDHRDQIINELKETIKSS